MKNNLFAYATSELSQDAFLCWLASYALEGAENDPALRRCAADMLTLFVPELKGQTFTLTGIERQKYRTDVLFTVAAGERVYKIAVEDKTFTGEHGGQLSRYLAALRAHHPGCEARGVYYKTEFQSDWRAVREAGYRIIGRADMLRLLSGYAGQTRNRVFLDYYRWLDGRQREAERYRACPLAEWGDPQILAFYDALQSGPFAREHGVAMGYGYVPNGSGGFQALWIGREEHIEGDTPAAGQRGLPLVQGVPCALYLQIEAKAHPFPICLKLSPRPQPGQDVAYGRIRDAVAFDENRQYRLGGFHFDRPGRLRCGRHMTVGVYHAAYATGEQLTQALAAAVADYLRLLDTL